MSSRVQKGSAVFKPIAKARPRAGGSSASRQPSVTPAASQESMSMASSRAGTSMPPPPPPSAFGTLSDPSMAGVSLQAPSQEVAFAIPTVPIPHPSYAAAPFSVSAPTRQRNNTAGHPQLSPPQAAIGPSGPLKPMPTQFAFSLDAPAGTSAHDTEASFSDVLGVSHSNGPPVTSTASGQPLVIPNNVPRGAPLSVPTNLSQGKSLTRQPSAIPSSSRGTDHSQRKSANTAQPSHLNVEGAQDVSATEVVSNDAHQQSTLPSGIDTNTPSQGKRKRQRSATATPGPEDDEDEDAESNKKGRGRRSRAPSLPPYDPNADPGEDLDPTVVTMASLCEDTGQGRVSSRAMEVQNNHSVWKQRNREKRSRMRALMEAKKYGRTDEEAELIADGAAPDESTTPAATPPPAAGSSNETDRNGPDFDYTQDLAASRFNVQVRIGPKGETIIDEDSLVVNRDEVEDTTNYTHVTESDFTKFVNSGTYGKRFRGSRWSAEETELFYEALSQFGENYELIAYVLPGRDRKSCKNKFKIEDKRNHARINHTLNNRSEIDIATLSRMTGKDFSGPVPEIRAPTPRPSLAPPPANNTESEAEEVSSSKRKPKRRAKSATEEDGVVVLGDIGSVQIDAEDS
ncbi:hypothetical protein BKA70DRAFT_318385 [Coprinopsis sp. MPI-PUGE-AT-0042]|nr:hypothetical protein BKA70DRAFT_318385 [Coprinopsis sp. MPI-PUGE-AT-0042]